jgi:plastocyanin
MVIASVLLGLVPAMALASQATPAPSGASLTRDELTALVEQFGDEVLVGGQVAPRFSRWVNDDVFIFLQLDSSDLAEATDIRYVGIGVKGVFCAETLPDRSFTHFHKYDAPEYGLGHGSEPGDQGYWLTWVSVDEFETRDGRHVAPGIDYEFSPTPPPACGAEIPDVAFDPPGADPLTSEEIRTLAPLFDSQILTGGQVAPRFHKWVNEDVSIFIQFDSTNLDEATALRDIGITVSGTFCAETQPTADFPHFHQTDAPDYAKGHGSAPGQTGYWLLWVATDTYETRDGRAVTPGVDREFSPTPPPACDAEGDAPAASADRGRPLTITGTEFAFTPDELRGRAGEALSVTFHNGGTVPHTFTFPAADVDTGSVAPGGEMTIGFTVPSQPGTYEVLCSFGGHPEAGMVGRFVVDPFGIRVLEGYPGRLPDAASGP